MPVAPTPLSGCPLKRLEIHGPPTCSIYDAAQLERSLTATLGAERPVTESHSNAMLQSHLGLKRVLSIKLMDLIEESCHKTEVVSIDKPSRRMCLKLHQKEQTVLFNFEESRDFNVAIYMLKKIGFQIQDGICLSPHTCTASGSGSLSYPTPSPSDFGLRLSSITPLQSPGDQLSQSPFSFTAMLNSEVPLTQIRSLDARHQPPSQDITQQPSQHMIPAMGCVSHFNHHQIYLSQHGNIYQPRVSSPLRNVVGHSGQTMSPTSNSQPSFFTNPVITEPMWSYRSISTPNPSPSFQQQPRCIDPGAQGSLDYQQSPPESQDTSASPRGGSQATDGIGSPLPLQSTEDLRKLMPQRRSLPFKKERKAKAATPTRAPEKKGGKKASRRRNKPQISPRVRRRDKNTSTDGADVPMDENAPEKAADVDSPRTDSQLALRHASSQPAVSRSDAPLACDSAFEAAELPAILITNPTLLERVNHATSKLLDQYSADTNRGCNGAACAQFYLEQIHQVRRDFWFSQLKQGEEGKGVEYYLTVS